ncbi:ketoacyl-ACP synthase III family protein [Antrihabitans cavernicola]|nr:ketoacyl-ACP synthase III family protein [Spelaeibacter cavernicola]
MRARQDVVADVSIAGLGACLPEQLSTADAIAAGRCSEADVRRTGITSVCIAANTDGPALAVRAARQAIDDAEIAAQDIDLLLYVRNHDEGQLLWPVGSFVQNEIGAHRAKSVEVRQMSNGGLAAIGLALPHVQSGKTVLVVTADTFPAPQFNRWSSDPGTVYADGAAAVVLRPGSGGRGSILSLAETAAPELELMSRPQRDQPDRWPLDLRSPTQRGTETIGLGRVVETLESRQADALERALEGAGTASSDISLFILPNLGKARLSAQIVGPSELEWDNTLWSWGRTVGHLGAGDQIAGLHHAIAGGRVAPGDTVCALGVGGGFSWSVMVVQIGN